MESVKELRVIYQTRAEVTADSIPRARTFSSRLLLIFKGYITSPAPPNGAVIMFLLL